MSRSSPAPAWLLEVTPPRGLTAGPGAVENLLAALALPRGCALEIAGDAAHGPQFLARAPSRAERDHLAGQVVGQYPQCVVRPLDDPAADPALLAPGSRAVACDLRLRAPSYLPLRTFRDQDARDGADPLLGVLGALGDLPPGMRGLAQLALWPADGSWGRDASALINPPRPQGPGPRPGAASGSGESALPLLVAGGLGLAGWQSVILYQAGDVLHLALMVGGALVAVPAGLWAARALRPAPPPDPQLVREKLAHRGFVARLRLLVVGGAPDSAGDQARRAALARLVAAYGPYDLPAGNALVMRPCAPDGFAWPRPARGGLRPGGPGVPLLNAREAASLWHLPAAASDVPGLRRGGSRQLMAAHPALLGGPAGGIALGVSHAQNKAVAVCLPPGFRTRHTLIVGGSGSGKTTLELALARGLLADPEVGVLVVDSHSALAPRVLEALPPWRAAQAWCVRLADTDRPVGLNLLDAHGGRTLSQIEEGLITGLKYHWEGSWGARMENVFRYSLRTLLHANAARRPAEQYTLLEINPLLTNGPFRMEALRQVQDADLQRYWLEVYAGLAPRFREEMIMPVQNKVDRFNQAVLRNIVGQSATTLSLTPLLERNAPLIVDTAAGLIGRDNAGLLGAVVLDLVADRLRERGEGGGRLVIIVDEFQQTPADWATMLEGLRKYGALCVLATQSLAALERTQPGLRGAVFGNQGTLAIFQTSAEDARYLAPELNDVVEVADLINLPVRHAYVRSTDGAERLPVFSVEVPLPPPGDPAVARQVVERSRQDWGRERAVVETARQAFLERLYRPAGSQVPGQGGGQATTAAPSSPTAPAGGKRVRSKNARRQPGPALLRRGMP